MSTVLSRWLLLACCLTALGCSGITSLLVTNHTSGRVNIAMKWHPWGGPYAGDVTSANLTLGPEESQKVDIDIAPNEDAFFVNVTGSANLKRSWSKPELPYVLTSRSSDSHQGGLDVYPDRLELVDESLFNKLVKYGPCSSFVFIALLLWLLTITIRALQKRRSSQAEAVAKRQ